MSKAKEAFNIGQHIRISYNSYRKDETVINMIDIGKVEEILHRIKKIKVALLGDLFLDVYWDADMRRSILSRETPHYPLPIINEKMSPGGGANAASNIAALGVEKLYVMGVTGKDWRGYALMEAMEGQGIDTSEIIRSNQVITNAYCKPYRHGISDIVYEDPRLDFENYAPLPRTEEDEIIAWLNDIEKRADALCVCDQAEFGCVTDRVREKLHELASKGFPIFVDSRSRIGLFKNMYLKPNKQECLSALDRINKQSIPDGTGCVSSPTTDEEACLALAKINNAKVCMTIGEKGCLYSEGESVQHIKSRLVTGEIDPCGAGDTFLSAYSCAIAAGVSPSEAASFACLATEVTIKKIGQTGTATPREVLELF